MSVGVARHPAPHVARMTSAHVRLNRNKCRLNRSPHNNSPDSCLQYISGDSEDNRTSSPAKVGTNPERERPVCALTKERLVVNAGFPFRALLRV